MLVERAGQRLTIQATPLSSRPASEGALGIELSTPRRSATALESLTGGLVITGLQAVSILYLPIALVQGLVQPGEARLVGLKGIFDMFGAAVQQDVQTRQPSGSAPPEPSNWTLSLIGLLSVSLGVMNLLPIPALDGGRILFTLFELVFRRRVPPKFETMVNGIAMLLLISLMLFINAMDFINPITPPIP
jgi:regulator of sigma E protease